MVNLSQFLPRLQPYVLGCPEPLAQQALLDSAIEFCTKSNAVSIQISPITATENVNTYVIGTPAQTGVSTILKLWYDGTVLPSIPYEQALSLFNNPNGTPRYYFGQYVNEVYSITLLPTPNKTVVDGLQIRAALTPTRSATEVHSILFDRYADAIVHGAISTLCAVPDQPFTNLPQAAASAVRFRAEANLARGEIMHGNVQSSLSVKMRAF